MLSFKPIDKFLHSATLQNLFTTDLRFLRWAAIVVAMLAALTIAVCTPYRVHPDEYVHMGGFQYFEGRFFPPNIGADGILYSGYGQSRVFSRELVYIVYGNLAHWLQRLTGVEPTYLIYRLFNVFLFFITLIIVFFNSVKQPLLQLFGFVLLSIPQFTYLYGYANSDAWAISFSLFTFIFAVSLWEKSVATWTFKDFVILGLLTGLVWVSKDNFVLSLLLPYSLLGVKLYEFIFEQHHRLTRQWFSKVAAGILALLVVAAPLRIVYTLSQGDYKAAIDRTREERAMPGYKPSNPTFSGLHLKAKGYSYNDLFSRKLQWQKTTARSFWGYYGHMRFITKPKWIYAAVLWGTLTATILTGWTLYRTQAFKRDRFLAICLPLSLLTLVLNIYASVRHSLYFDFQPQGRYIFPSLVSLCFLVMGTATLDSFPVKITRGFICASIYTLGLYSLLFVGIAKMVVYQL